MNFWEAYYYMAKKIIDENTITKNKNGDQMAKVTFKIDVKISIPFSAYEWAKRNKKGEV